MNNNHFRLEDPILRTGIDLRYGEPMPKIFGVGEIGLEGRSKVRATYNPCIRLKDKNNLGTLIHEIIHCVTDVFERRGITHIYETDEHYAYLVEYYFTGFVKKLTGKKK